MSYVLDLGGTLFKFNKENNLKTPEEKDADAIKSDWDAVGKDLNEVINKG